MAANPFAAGNDFEALARQYWSAWGEAMRAASGQPAVPPGMQGWHDAVEWWSRLAHGGRSEANTLVDRFNAQARHWFGQMQQVAAQFAGQDHGASQVAQAWKQALGAAGENPFPEIFRAMRGQHLQGLDQWIEDASPYLDAMRREGMSWLSLPAFGIGREHQERLQALARAQVEYQERNAEYNALMLKTGQRAFELFESRLAEREEPGRQLTTARALFDLWIDSAEEAYAEIALSPEFRSVYGALVNAQMRLRAGVQREVELASGLLGMPTRSEVDAAHRKVAELERQLRRMRAAAPPPAAPTTDKASQADNSQPPATTSASNKHGTPRKAVKSSDAGTGSAGASNARPSAKASAAKAAQPAKASSKPTRRTVPATRRPAQRAAARSLLGGIAVPAAPAAPDKRNARSKRR